MESTTYGHALRHILGTVTPFDVREAIVREYERQELTQAQLEERSGCDQGHLSKLLDLSKPLAEVRARILFNIIEKGLRVPLSAFFAQIEGVASPVQQAAAPNDEAPSLRAEVDTLRQEISDLRKEAREQIRDVARAEIARVISGKRKDVVKTGSRSAAGDGDGRSAPRGQGKAHDHRDVRGDARARKKKAVNE